MAIVVFIHKCLEGYEEILNSLENNEASKKTKLILDNITNLETYYNARKEKLTKILQEDIIEEIEQRLWVLNA